VGASVALLQRAVAHHQAGRLGEAETLYRQILATTPKHFDATHLLGVIALQTGRLDEAHALISDAITANPKAAAAHNNLGNVYLRQGRLDAAQASFRRAVELQPGFGDAHFNLGTQLRRQGKLQEAATQFRRAVAADAKSFPAQTSLGATLLDLSDARGAVRAFEAAVKLKPDSAEALSHLGIALSGTGELPRALEIIDRASKIDPKSTAVLANRGSVLSRLGRYAEARTCLERVLSLEPTSAPAHCNLGNVLRDSGEAAAALERFKRAAELDPALVEAQIGLTLALRDLGRDEEARASVARLGRDHPASAAALIFEAAVCLERDDTKGAAAALGKAIALQNSNADAHYQLGNVLMRQLRWPAAIRSYEAALAANPSHVQARWAMTMAQLHPIYSDVREEAKARVNFARMLGELDKWFDATRSVEGYMAVGSTQPFHLAYQEADNHELLGRYGALCARLMAPWQAERFPVLKPRTANGAVRVGIVSAHIRNHSVWNAIVKGWVKGLDSKRFELHLFNIGGRSDAETDRARRIAQRLETGKRELPHWAATIAESRLDVLIYPEIGMDPLTVKLASLRLAPAQAATWGHPETTGLPTIDYYLSAEGLEPPNAARHYTERLVLLSKLGVCYEPLSAEASLMDLTAHGLPADMPLLLCAGTPFKYGPAHDRVWVEIARRARGVRLVFFRPGDSEASPAFEERITRAFTTAGLRFADHATFVPQLDRARFFALMQRAHLMLDTIGFSGFNTVIQAIECGLPVVSREGQFLRGRLGSGILRHMGMDALVADSDDAYVELAVALTRDPSRRDDLRDEIIRRRGALFGDTAPIRALETFLESAARTPPRS
jgi:predicted O-linked N-acetylglucosamine transferase (SPINDLY family)